MKLISRIEGLLILTYRVIKRIIEEKDFLKWHDVWVFIFFLFVTRLVNKFFFCKPVADQVLLQNFIEWFAVLYALILTMIIGEAWNRLNRINSEIDREADALKLMLQTGKLFSNRELFGRLLIAVYTYADCILELKIKDARSHPRSRQHLQTIRNCIDAMLQDGTGTKNSSPEFLKAELLHQYCETFDARGDRFDLMEQKMPVYAWMILGAFSAGWLWGFWWLEFHHETMEWYVLTSTVLSIIGLYYVARSLNDPTKGAWKLTFNPFKENLFAGEFRELITR